MVGFLLAGVTCAGRGRGPIPVLDAIAVPPRELRMRFRASSAAAVITAPGAGAPPGATASRGRQVLPKRPAAPARGAARGRCARVRWCPRVRG